MKWIIITLVYILFVFIAAGFAGFNTEVKRDDNGR